MDELPESVDIKAALRSAESDVEILKAINRLLECGGNGIFNEIIRNKSACYFIQRSLSQTGVAPSEGPGVAQSNSAWLLFLLSFGTIHDLPYLLSSGKISPAFLTSTFIRNLRKATIVEVCLSNRIVRLTSLQQSLSFSHQSTGSSDASSGDVKELIIDCIFDKLLDGKIDEEQDLFFVSSVCGTDRLFGPRPHLVF